MASAVDRRPIQSQEGASVWRLLVDVDSIDQAASITTIVPPVETTIRTVCASGAVAVAAATASDYPPTGVA